MVTNYTFELQPSSLPLRVRLSALLTCDRVLLLQGWDTNRECVLLRDVAAALGLPIYAPDGVPLTVQGTNHEEEEFVDPREVLRW